MTYKWWFNFSIKQGESIRGPPGPPGPPGSPFSGDFATDEEVSNINYLYYKFVINHYYYEDHKCKSNCAYLHIFDRNVIYWIV